MNPKNNPKTKQQKEQEQNTKKMPDTDRVEDPGGSDRAFSAGQGPRGASRARSFKQKQHPTRPPPEIQALTRPGPKARRIMFHNLRIFTSKGFVFSRKTELVVVKGIVNNKSRRR